VARSGGVVSVALSVSTALVMHCRLEVIEHAAWWCPDFPHQLERELARLHGTLANG